MICAAASPSFQSIFRKLTHGLSAISLSVFYSCAAICQTSTSHKKLSLRLKLPDQSPPSIPLLWVWLRASVHITVLSSTAEGGGKGEEEKKACWCFTGILLKGENDVKRRKQSCLWYIYTIGCKSFLMGSRVQSWGRDYQGRSGSGMTCICPRPRPLDPAPLHSGLLGPGQGMGVAWMQRVRMEPGQWNHGCGKNCQKMNRDP